MLAVLLSAVMNNMTTVLMGALSIDATNATGVVKDAMICANVAGWLLAQQVLAEGGQPTSVAMIAQCHEFMQGNRQAAPAGLG
jgi:arsenical pump membrane protein